MTELLWTQPEWLSQAHEWIHARVEVTGPIQQPHVRPWSTVLRVPTAGGDVWFKAVGPAFRHEPAVTKVLSGVRPDLVPPPLALDLGRGWMLLADGGARLREVGPTAEQWEALLPLYAELQIEAASHLDELLDAGLPDQRLERLPELYAELPGPPELAAKLAAMCEELAGHGIPETIQHDDFHDGQIFLRVGHYLFLDWGDACCSHPFFSMTIAVWNVRSRDRPRLRDAYLERWAPYQPRDRLLDAFDLAFRLGTVCRAASWQRFGAGVDPALRAEYSTGAAAWLRRWARLSA